MARAMLIVALLLAAVAVAPFAQARNVVTEKKGDSESSSEAPAPAADAPAEGPEGPASSPEPSAADAPEPSADD